MSILVTGASGFIGSWLALEHKNLVVSVSRNVQANSDFFIEDINRHTDWQTPLSGIKSVIHLAGTAHNRSGCHRKLLECDYEGTLKLMRDCGKYGVGRFVYISTVNVYSNFYSRHPFGVKTQLSPTTVKAEFCVSIENNLKEISNELGIELVIVRSPLVYGPNAPGNFSLLTKLVKKAPLLPFALVKNRRDFISVQNLVDLLIVCASHENAAGHVFLASDNETVSTREFIDAVAYGQGKKVLQVPIPIGLMRFFGRLIGKTRMIDQLFDDLEVDSSNISEILNWTPPYTMKEAMAMLRTEVK
ncbi:NAD-dependent epimerase/dehydratase family protein [Vibrio gallaecicus]|uniref:NAD-dependent epimerase/dehydratase family protein n=1 Tax=Vibrio gallaecicus TaxID=552386 RepID=A0ABV4NA51_9VIBR